MNYLHVIQYGKSREFSIINRLNRIFDKEKRDNKQKFYLYNCPDKEVFSELSMCQVYGDNNSSLVDLLEWTDVVVMHAIPFGRKFDILWPLFKYKDKKKYIWIVWGHDVYDIYWDSHRKERMAAGMPSARNPLYYLKPIIAEKLHAMIVKSTDTIVALPGDWETIRRWWNVKDTVRYIIPNMTSYGEKIIPNPISKKENDLNIIVGHCPSACCRFEKTYELLSSIDDGEMQIYSPLFYAGNEEPVFVQNIKHLGKQLFGDRYHPLTDFIPFEDYCELMSTMDVAIENQNRQMAMGNILIQLYYGTKVFVSDDNCVGEYYKSIGAHIFGIGELTYDSLHKELSDEEKEKNKSIIHEGLTDKCFDSLWKQILDI